MGLLIFAAAVVACAPGRAAAAPEREEASATESVATLDAAGIHQFFQSYCIDCHGSEKQRAGLALHDFTTSTDLQRERKRWESVMEMLQFQAMPPEDQPQPSDDQRAQVVEWLESRLFQLDCDLPADPGRVTIRRLNRAEYNNTIRDLIGVAFKPAADFPSDDVGYGFDNIGDVLSLPPLLFEKYMDAAERIADAAIRVPGADQAPRERREKEQLQASGSAHLSDYGVYGLPSNGAVSSSLKAPRDGRYRVRVEAGAQQAGDELAKLELRLDGEKVHVADVEAPRDALQWYEHDVQLTQGEHQIAAAFINDYYNPEASDANQRDRNMYFGAIELVGPLDVLESELPETHRRIVTVVPGAEVTVDEAARRVLAPLATRAFRRPLRDGELEPLIGLVNLAIEQGDAFERGVQVALTAVLVSPHFLFRVEQDPAPDDPQRKHEISQYELATRLSYFLWSSMPDETLFDLAAQGQLHEEKVLRAQVARMLQDAKAAALVRNFGGQWLNLRLLDEMTPDPERFSQFDEPLRQAMRQETLLFFEEVMRQDRSVLDFLDGQFTFVNERLAKHYGIEGVRGEQFQRVSLEGRRRAGVLTQASILTLTSNPTRTSPVKRGKWIMENILGTPPPDPPANVPQLEEAQASAPNASLREQLELHRRSPTCASCHRQMDPLGFGFENFDAVGRWRDRDGKFAIDASGTLPGGESFDGPVELIDILKQRDEQFCRALAERMLTFALGRGLQYYDRCVVDEIVEALRQDDYRFSTLVTEIVTSEPFRLRRGDGGSE